MALPNSLAVLWILTKISILKAIHNIEVRRIKWECLWILTKISILKAIHNTKCTLQLNCGPVNPH